MTALSLTVGKGVAAAPFLLAVSLGAVCSCCVSRGTSVASRTDSRTQPYSTEKARRALLANDEEAIRALGSTNEWMAFADAYNAIFSTPNAKMSGVFQHLQEVLDERVRALRSLERRGLLTSRELEIIEHLSRTVVGRHILETWLLMDFLGHREFLRVREDLPYVVALGHERRQMPWLVDKLVQPFRENLQRVKRVTRETIDDIHEDFFRHMDGLPVMRNEPTLRAFKALPFYDDLRSVLERAEHALMRIPGARGT